MKDSKQLFRTLVIANLFLYFGFNVWRALFNNFAVEEIGVTATQIGLPGGVPPVALSAAL